MSGPSRVRRWPLHPPPCPGEALTSWLERLAGCYGLSVDRLLRNNLGAASTLLDHPDCEDLDWDPPAAILEALAMRTGVPLGMLRMTTFAGWVPWLADTLDPTVGREHFHTYVRQDSVLLAPGEARRNHIHRWLPWLPREPDARRAAAMLCPRCADKPDFGIPLTAGLPIMLSCLEHGCRLEDDVEVRIARAMGETVPSRPAPETVIALDRLTHEGLTTGKATLPRRTVHAGVWFRLLRTLLDEVSLTRSRLRVRSVPILEQIWEASQWPERGGLLLDTWRPYEYVHSTVQTALLETAATAVDLIQSRQIPARGTFGDLLTIAEHQHVYDGDLPLPPVAADLLTRTGTPGPSRYVAPPRREWTWGSFQQACEEYVDLARTDGITARQLLHILTWRCQSTAEFETERRLLIDLGVPAELLPDARGLNRFDLLAKSG